MKIQCFIEYFLDLFDVAEIFESRIVRKRGIGGAERAGACYVDAAAGSVRNSASVSGMVLGEGARGDYERTPIVFDPTAVL